MYGCNRAGELGKLDMLHETILHLCIKQLLEKKRTTSVTDMAEDLECLCQIMKTVGRRLDTEKAKVNNYDYQLLIKVKPQTDRCFQDSVFTGSQPTYL